MIIKAGNGCFLTERGDFPYSLRSFETEITVSSVNELSNWVEITAGEKDEMEARELFFEVNDVNVPYLRKVDTLLKKVAVRINNAGLTNDEALEMKQYYPKWEELLGEQVYSGYKFTYEDILFEVVEPHIVTEDKRPNLTEPMAIDASAEDTTATEPAPKVYYVQVTPTENQNAL